MADKENSPPPGGTLVNYIYRCGTWWEVGKLTYMVHWRVRKSPVFLLSGVDRYGNVLQLGVRGHKKTYSVKPSLP